MVPASQRQLGTSAAEASSVREAVLAVVQTRAQGLGVFRWHLRIMMQPRTISGAVLMATLGAAELQKQPRDLAHAWVGQAPPRHPREPR